MPDWAAIREEYITGDIGLRTLAEKHGVSFNTLKDRVKREGWGESRRTYRESMGFTPAAKAHTTPRTTAHHTTDTTDTTPNIEYVPGAQQQANMEALFSASEKALEKALIMIDTCKYAKDIKAITGALKDIKEIQMIKSALDEREQIARIEKLRAESAEGKTDDNIEVVFIDRVKEAAK